MTTKGPGTGTNRTQEATDRVGEVLAEYKRMKGVEGDTLQLTTYDLLAGLMADVFHYARTFNLDANLAISDGYRMFREESS